MHQVFSELCEHIAQEMIMSKQKQADNSIIQIVLARDAISLQNRITKILLEEIMNKQDGDEIIKRSFSRPGFVEKFKSMVKEDLKALHLYWVNHGSETKISGKFNKLKDEEKDITIGGILESELNSIKDSKFKIFCKKVLRYNILYQNIKSFYESYLQYQENYDNDNFNKLLYFWSKLFAVLICPVVHNQSEPNLHLYIMCVAPEYKPYDTIYTNMDKHAYNIFHSYVKTGSNLWNTPCEDYRKYMLWGIRSLNCIYFNRLSALESTIDHAVALLCGFRSGIQFQILSPQNNIIGIVAVYTPIYDFWNIFDVEGNGSLMREDDYVEADNKYSRFLQDVKDNKEFNNNEDKLTKYFVQPLLKTPENEQYDHLSTLSSSWVTICTNIDEKLHPLPTEIEISIKKMEKKGINEESAKVVVDWFNTQLSPKESGHILKNSKLSPELQNSINLHKEYWPSEVNKKVEKLTRSFISDLVNRQKVKDYFSKELWNTCEFLTTQMADEDRPMTGPTISNRSLDSVNGVKNIEFELLYWFGCANIHKNGNVSDIRIGLKADICTHCDISSYIASEKKQNQTQELLGKLINAQNEK